MISLEPNRHPETPEKKQQRKALAESIARYRLSGTPRAATDIASNLALQGKYLFARAWALEALKLSDGECSDARLILGNLYCLNKEYIAAWHQYKQIKSGQAAVMALMQMVNICAAMRKPVFCDRLVYKLNKEHAESCEAQVFVASYYRRIGDNRNAWRSIRQALTASPENIQALELAYECAIRMEEYATATRAAERLVSLISTEAKFYDYLGKAYHLNCQPSECCKAYAQASLLAPRNLIYYLNSVNRVRRIARNGDNAFRIAACLSHSAQTITDKIAADKDYWSIYGSDSLLTFAFHAAYSPLNLKQVYEPYLQALTQAFQPLINSSIENSEQALDELSIKLPLREGRRDGNAGHTKKARIGFLSRNFYAHSNTHAFVGYFQFLDRTQFEVIVIHRHETTIDADHLYINSLADEVVYLDESLSTTNTYLIRLGLDILFFTDIGMDPFDFLIPELRTCKIQISGWGLPHTTGLKCIDYYLSSSWLEAEYMQKEYTEKLIRLDGFPCCFPRDLLYYRSKINREHFILPNDILIIGCVQVLSKVHPDMDIILEAIAKQLPDAAFAFMCTSDHQLDAEFVDRLNRRAPTASKRLLLMNRCPAKDFLALCNSFDIMLDTPYYGAGVTAYLSIYVGTPTVCFNGGRLRDSTFASIYRHLKVAEPPIASSIPEYIDTAVTLCRNTNRRNALKKELIEKAHHIYDDQTYIRSFESFCSDTLKTS
jgi:protein O-GlcNAc transferase